MRSQERSFVIEYKSSRRQLLKQDRSIWGSTNFKALAKEAEVYAPQLFKTGPEDVPSVPERSTAIKDAPVVGGRNDQNRGPAPQEAAQEDRGAVERQSYELSGAEPEESENASPGNRLKKRPRRQMAKRSETQPEHGATSVDISASSLSLEAPADDLTALEEENRQLKAQLEALLVQQNKQLRKMLERFGER